MNCNNCGEGGAGNTAEVRIHRAYMYESNTTTHECYLCDKCAAKIENMVGYKRKKS